MVLIDKVVPHIPSQNMEESIDFMVNIFGFQSIPHSESYTELRAGNQVIGILKAQGKPNQQSLYLHVKDVDEFWSKTKTSLEKEKPKAPFTQEYGMREIHVVVPGTNTLLFVGSPVAVGT